MKKTVIKASVYFSVLVFSCLCLTCGSGNAVHVTFDRSDTIYIAFKFQNRIEKYSPEGKLMTAADRSLNFKITRPKTLIKRNPSGTISGIGLPTAQMSYVSSGIGIDHRGRIWVTTYTRQPERVARNQHLVVEEEKPYLKFELYRDDGVLLGEMPWTFDFKPSSYTTFRLFGNRIFFRDADLISVYEYKIVEK